jgi:hypothetical protein
MGEVEQRMEQLPRGLGDDCKDAGGRATQGAVAEGKIKLRKNTYL